MPRLGYENWVMHFIYTCKNTKKNLMQAPCCNRNKWYFTTYQSQRIQRCPCRHVDEGPGCPPGCLCRYWGTPLCSCQHTPPAVRHTTDLPHGQNATMILPIQTHTHTHTHTHTQTQPRVFVDEHFSCMSHDSPVNTQIVMLLSAHTHTHTHTHTHLHTNSALWIFVNKHLSCRSHDSPVNTQTVRLLSVHTHTHTHTTWAHLHMHTLTHTHNIATFNHAHTPTNKHTHKHEISHKHVTASMQEVDENS